MGENKNSKQQLYHQKNVSNPLQTSGLQIGNMSSGRNAGTKSPSNMGMHAQDPQDNIDIDVGNDDYDEETDEFANYSH